MCFHATRQPIFDIHKNLYGYELLFKDSLNHVFPSINTNEATSTVIETNKFNVSISEFTANKPAFIKFTLDTITQGYPQMLTTEEVVVEIVEAIKPGKRLLAACKDLHEKGYNLTLDNYVHQNVWGYFYPYISIIKIDLLKTSSNEINEIKQAIVKFPKIKLLAENVETHELYQQALAHGFELFQGYFFAKPEKIENKSLSPSQVAMAELLYESSKPELDLMSITHVFERDVTLSYKLLRYVNSSIFMRQSEISSIKQALVSLGLLELKRFIGLLFAVCVNPDKPSELINSSMARAKFCELVTPNINSPVNTSVSFLIGLLSMIDAILDEDLEIILAKLPLAQEITAPLLTKKGTMAVIIKLVEFIEQAQWAKTTIVMEKLGLKKENVIEYYHQALIWADEQTKVSLS